MRSFADINSPHSPYLRFSADEWGCLRKEATLSLTEEDIIALRGYGETVSLREVEQIYLPLSRLLSLYVEAMQALFRVTNNFLADDDGAAAKKLPYIIGVAGSVAVGKSTTSRLLRALLARWPNHPKVQLITTDGFLYPNKILEARGLMERKGFPESFDLRALRQFLTAVKSGVQNVEAPVYSHVLYDVVADEKTIIAQPDILIVEGLNVLQPARLQKGGVEIPFVSDFFDFSIYIDAENEIVQEWYIERFLELRRTAFRKPNAYFARYADLDDKAARKVALDIWTRINYANLEQNILPTRGRANLILHKNANHHISEVLLRKI